MQKIMYFAVAVGFLTALYFLYQYQLGSIAFFLLSIFFFRMAIKQFFHDGQEKKESKQNRNYELH